MKYLIPICAIFLFSFFYCDSASNKDKENMAFKNIEYVTKFPLSFSLPSNDAHPSGVDVIGIQNFAIIDSVMILSTSNPEGFLCLYSLTSMKNQGHFFKQGNGPYEFSWPISLGTSVSFIHENDTLYSYTLDFAKGVLYRLNINECIKTNKLSVVEIDQLPNYLRNFLYLDSTYYFFRELNDEATQQIRYVISNGIKDTLPVLQQLNKAAVQKGEDDNILAAIIKTNKNGFIIESPLLLNYLNLYKLDGSFTKTICIGKELDRITNIESIKRDDRIFTFDCPRMYQDFWAVMYTGERMEIYGEKRTKLPSILFFDWQGHPLAEIKMNKFSAIFDIDFKHNLLYTFDVDSDEFLYYDITSILEKLNLAKHNNPQIKN